MPIIIALCGTSGVGKWYLKQRLKKIFKLVEPQVYTTRKQRKNEKQSDRVFIPREEFLRKQQNGEITLPQELYGNLYGFDRKAFEGKQGIITEIHVGVVKKFRQMFPSATLIALTTTNANFLKHRLRLRGDNSAEAKKRIEKAEEEIKQTKRLRRLFDINYTVDFENESRIVKEITKKIRGINNAGINPMRQRPKKPVNFRLWNTGRTKRTPDKSPRIWGRRRS